MPSGNVQEFGRNWVPQITKMSNLFSLRKGKSVRSAIDGGYNRALTTIIDANVTTLVAALVLYQFGTGPIRGFATVLFWGIIISMFTAIFVTRTIFNSFADRKGLKKLSI